MSQEEVRFSGTIASHPKGSRQEMLEQRERLAAGAYRAGVALHNKQPRRLVLALVLLLVTLCAVVVRYSEFWFGGDETPDTESEVAQPASVPTTTVTAASTPTATPTLTVSQALPAAAPAVLGKAPGQTPAQSPAKKQVAAKISTPTPVADSGIVASNRTVLAPLAVEVVAGDTHKTLHPGSNAVRVEIPSHSGSAMGSMTVEAPATPATNAAEREPMPAGMAASPDLPLNSSYPLLAQRMKVQGSVVLQVLIGADGVIQSLHVVSGPAILASAAQQAVREWRFKPYLQNGQPVETKANITVSFTIKVSDNASKAS
jgi:protein TonB